jgi:hypothetical protein
MTNPTPIIILAGNAGAGKDTVASYIANRYGGVTVGQADVLKHMARDFFGFTDRQLFGPSECRNELDTRFYSQGPVAWSTWLKYADAQMAGDNARKWCRAIFPQRAEEANIALGQWFTHHILPRAEADGGISPRLVLQTLGTEWGRALEKDVWARYSREIALKLIGGGWDYTREQGLGIDSAFRPYTLAIITDGRFANEIVGVKAINGIAVLVQRKADMRAAAEAGGVQGHVSEAELDGIPSHFYNWTINNNFDIPGLHHQADRMVLAFWDHIKPIQRFGV